MDSARTSRELDIIGMIHTEAAGQRVPHLHVHVVPRYPGGEPTKIFLQGNFEPVSTAEQESVAEIVRAALDDCNQQANQEFTGH